MVTQRCTGFSSYSRRLPALVDHSQIKIFAIFPYKNQPTQLRLWNQVNNIPVFLPSSSVNIWDESVEGFMSYDRTDKQQTNRDYYFIYIDAINVFCLKVKCWRTTQLFLACKYIFIHGLLCTSLGTQLCTSLGTQHCPSLGTQLCLEIL